MSVTVPVVSDDDARLVLARAVRDAALEAGITQRELGAAGLEGVPLRAFRHMVATELLAAGVDVRTGGGPVGACDAVVDVGDVCGVDAGDR